MKNFNELGLAEPLLRAVSTEGYTIPTPIQSEVIPALLAGKDVTGIAQTGTGKTAAFVLPLLDRLARERIRPAPKACCALILTPTRELASQIADNIRSYSKFMTVSVAVVVGGVKPGPQIRALSRGIDIVVATPGRLLDHMNTGVIRLDQTTSIVLDEADQMLDLGFMPAIRKIIGRLPKVRQTVLMSATMPPQIRALARDFQTDPVEIAVAAISRPIELISQSVRHTPAAQKRDALTDILSDASVARAIVFTRTKRGADKVNQHLQKAGLSSAAIHGNKSQGQRTRALESFRSGKTKVMVATDIAARGIDIDDVSHVINFELPNVPEAYVHRIGRTARAGRTGIAISLCDPAERGLLHDIERLIGNRLDSDGSHSSMTAALPDTLPATPKKGSRRFHPKRPKQGAPKNRWTGRQKRAAQKGATQKGATNVHRASA
ncbi:MAG: DEAD/DEAH box helicase [Fimbriimonadaceae bacterium]|nr:DEAD/DEAH box helicase [Alphaproteobacteria bacterium]